ncbi:MAG TPA: hypothetical protein VGB16_02645, partial [candidate division Zixibacteria bacterium]
MKKRTAERCGIGIPPRHSSSPQSGEVFWRRRINLPSPSPRFGPPRRAIGETGEAGLFSKEGKKEVSPFEKGGFDGSI